MKRSMAPIMVSVCVLALSLCLGCSDSTTDTSARTPDAESKPAEKPALEEATPQLTAPEQEATSPQPRGSAETAKNLINDPSLEGASLGRLPRGWSTYLKDGPKFRCETVTGGHTGTQCLQIEGQGTRAAVFTNGVPLDRTKRYALKGWAKFEGDGNGKAIIKFNYFHSGKWLGTNDLIGVTRNQEGWRLLEKTDTADDFPEASQIWVSCNVEGSGKAWFDDLELVAYDRQALTADFASRHGKDNLASRLLVLDRWTGQWESTTSHKPTDTSARTAEKLGIRNVAKILEGRFLQSYWTSADGDEENLSLLTYDENSAAYRLWTFSSSGAVLEFAGQWDDATNTFALQLVPPTPGVTGTSITRFVDAETIETHLIVKDKSGVVTRDVGETLTRKSKTATSDIPPAREATAAQQSPESKILLFDQLPGSWQLSGTLFKAEWTPQQTQLAGSGSSTRILGGRFIFIETKIEQPEDTIQYMLMNYDAQRKSYRRWNFPLDGQAAESIGQWDVNAKSMTWSHTMGDGLTHTTTERCVDADTIEWILLIKDVDGKVYLHLEAKSTRAK